MPKNAVGYIRVSTSKQVKGHSLQYQEDAIKKYCANNDFELVKLFVDKGLSGYKHRPKFMLMNEFIDQGDVSAVVTYSFTRYGRSAQDLLASISSLESKDVLFISVKEQFDASTKTGKLLLGMLALIADFEAETIRERMEAGRAWAKEHGTKSGKPFGRPKVEINFDEVRRLRSKSCSWRTCARLVGVSTPTLIKRAEEEGIY